MGDGRRAYGDLLETSGEWRSLGRGKRKLEGNTKMVLSELRRGVDWIELAQNRNGWRAFVNLEMNPRVP
jgi:hypothetical protein